MTTNSHSELSNEFVSLAGGLIIPLDAFKLAHELFRRDFLVSHDGDVLRIKGPNGTRPELSPEDVARITRWKMHLIALLDYRAPA